VTGPEKRVGGGGGVNWAKKNYKEKKRHPFSLAPRSFEGTTEGGVLEVGKGSSRKDQLRKSCFFRAPMYAGIVGERRIEKTVV